MNPILFNIQHFSIQDGPGIRTTLFFKGCPLNCIWCHNPEGKSVSPVLSFSADRCVMCGRCFSVCPNDAHNLEYGLHNIERNKCVACGKCADECSFDALEILGKNYTLDSVLSEVQKDSGFYGETGGVTISGGEPFAQYEALIEVLKALKQNGYNICLETSGYTSREKIKKAAEYVDVFLYDFKHTNPKKHIEFTGVKQDVILDNLYALDEVNANVILRCPIIPCVNDYSEHFEGIARVANEHPCIKSVELMPYHPLGISKSEKIGIDFEYKNKEFFDIQEAEKICEIISLHTQKPVLVSK
ncbi:MAG: glycyl-radical enzyme activating protein [Clostridia bacterium]|nr:glycyl-radical enzyme activating protein [Clostridia bacterium]